MRLPYRARVGTVVDDLPQDEVRFVDVLLEGHRVALFDEQVMVVVVVVVFVFMCVGLMALGAVHRSFLIFISMVSKYTHTYL